MGDVNNRGGCACVEAEDTWKIAVLSPQFCYESEMALKIKSLRKKKKKATLDPIILSKDWGQNF